jgi:hypothetical protein
LSRTTKRIAVVAPEDLSKKGGYPMKVYLEAEVLSEFGEVSLYGYNVRPSDNYKHFELTAIAPHTHSTRKSLRVYLTLCRTIINSKFDYVFLPTVFHPLFPLLFVASKIASSKIIYDFRDPIYGTMATMKDEVQSRTGNGIISWSITKLSFLVEVILIRSSDYILTVSPLLVDYIKKFKGKNHNDIFLYYNYIPSEVKDIHDDVLPVELQRAIKDKIVICYLGHIQTAIRGIESIFKVLKESSNRDVFLVLLGEIDNKPYWESLIKELGCEKQIMIIDPKPKPEALGYLRRFDYAILGPSPSNALPSKIFDTLSVGIKFILPANMVSAIEVLGSNCVTYRDYTDLGQLFDELKKPKSDIDFYKIEDTMKRYSLRSRLESILHIVFKS